MNNYIHDFLQTDGDLFYIILDLFIVKEDSLNEKQKTRKSLIGTGPESRNLKYSTFHLHISKHVPELGEYYCFIHPSLPHYLHSFLSFKTLL